MNIRYQSLFVTLSCCALIDIYASPVSAQVAKPKPSIITVKDYLGKERLLFDGNGDGWDDHWCSNYPKLNHRNKAIDTDKDGLTDYEEMVMWRNPYTKGPLPREFTPEEMEKARAEAAKAAIVDAAAKAKEQAHARALLEPWMVADVPSGESGKTYSVEVEIAEKRKRMGEGLAALVKTQSDELNAGVAAADRMGLAQKFTTPGGGDAVVVGETNGLPDYVYTRNSVSADTISVDALWPEGSTGLNLTGTEPGKPSVRLGVWEPSGPVLDHTEFAATTNNIDTTNATTGWTASAGGSFVLNTTAGNFREGTGCLNLLKAAGSATVLYSRTQPAAANFTDRTVLVWYFNDNTASLPATGTAVELRFGSGAAAYWFRRFERGQLAAGWNLLSMKVATASGTVGAPVLTACNYTAINVSYITAAVTRTGVSQRLDFWRLSDTRVTNMDRTGSVADHSTHVTGTITARGAEAAARGMAYTAEVHSRDVTSDRAEMAAIFSNSDPSDDLFVSNHSYGPNPGWSTLPVTVASNVTFLNSATNTTSAITVQPGNYGLWQGNIGISGAEDFRFGFYSDALTREIDRTVYTSNSLLPVWAAGNDRGDPASVGHFEIDPVLGFIATDRVRPTDGGATGYDTLPPDSVAKNILTVGSVGNLVGGWVTGSNSQPSTFSAFGPTDDGRIKPDICANGEGVYSTGFSSPYVTFSGTSQATPSIVGAIGLQVQLIQRFRGSAYQPPAALLKSLMMHTADDMLTVGPDYRSGYGQANGQRAGEFIEKSETLDHGADMRMVLLQNGGPQLITVRAIGGTPLKVTVGTTDPAGIASPDSLDPPDLKLVNDFSLQVTTAGAGPFNPFILTPANPAAAATTGINTRDNVEQVVVPDPIAGQLYTISIGPAAGETFVNDLGQPAPQTAAVLISGTLPDPDLEFRVTGFVKTGTAAYTLVWPAIVGVVYRIQTSMDLITWEDATGDIVPTISPAAREVINPTPANPRRFWRVRKVL